MKLRFSNYDSKKLADVLFFDKNTQKFSFVYKAFEFESKSFNNGVSTYEELIFTPKHTSIEIKFSRKALSEMISYLSKTYNCHVDIPNNMPKAQYRALNQLIQIAGFKDEF